MTLRRRRPGLVYPVNEDWHYVGDTGEPAFETGWDNAGAIKNLAFRIRETAIVDIQGWIENTDAPLDPTANLFTLPVGYRPAFDTFETSCTVFVEGGTTAGHAPIPLNVTSSGTVSLKTVDMSTQFGGTPYIQYAYIQGQFFLSPASAP